MAVAPDASAIVVPRRSKSIAEMVDGDGRSSQHLVEYVPTIPASRVVVPMTRSNRLQGRRSCHAVQKSTIFTVSRFVIISHHGSYFSVHPRASMLFDFVVQVFSHIRPAAPHRLAPWRFVTLFSRQARRTSTDHPAPATPPNRPACAAQYSRNGRLTSSHPASSGRAAASSSPGPAAASSTHSRSPGPPLITSMGSFPNAYSYGKSRHRS